MGVSIAIDGPAALISKRLRRGRSEGRGEVAILPLRRGEMSDVGKESMSLTGDMFSKKSNASVARISIPLTDETRQRAVTAPAGMATARKLRAHETLC